MRFQSMVVLAAVCAGLSGCATAVNPGKTRSVEPVNGTGPHVKVARLRLEHTGPQLAVYDGDTSLEILDEASHDLHVTMCRTFRENGTEPPGMVTVNTDCMSRILFPYVELDKSVTHTLRLVRGGQETAVTVTPRMHWQWIWLNAVCLAAVPICWAVDAASGNMKYFGSLDVTQAFLHPGR